VSLTDVDITGRVFLYAAQEGSIRINGGSITKRSYAKPSFQWGDTAIGISGGVDYADDPPDSPAVVIDGTQIRVEDGDGIVARDRATALIRNFDLSVSSTSPASGVYLQKPGDVGYIGYAQKITLENGKLSTEGNEVAGIYTDDWNGSLSADHLSIVTTGDHAHGIWIEGGEVALNDVEIAVNSANGLYVNDPLRSRITAPVKMNTGRITVNGPGGYGGLVGDGGYSETLAVTLTQTFPLAGAGNTLEGTLGVDTSWRGGRTSLYGDISHQQRLDHAGMQGWNANVGLRVGF